MKVLHVSNDFSLTKVHSNLYKALDRKNIDQIVFNPVRHNTPVGNNNIDFKSSHSKIIYSKKLKKYHRVFFRRKINFLFADLESKFDLKSIDIVHATTLYSDGAVALKIFKKYKTPYIVAVRGTDVSLFLKYRPDLIFLLREILSNAHHTIFLGMALKKQFFNNSYVKSLGPNILNKLRVICNGIDDFWLTSPSPIKRLKPYKILYIGRFDGNKNTANLIDAILRIKKEYPGLELNLVGKGGGDEERVMQLSFIHKDFIKYHGAIHDKVELQKVYLSNHIFAMPSISETFGLVYLEALSQGLPILCSKNQGVDNTFESKIGKFVDPKSVDSIADGLKCIINEYDSFELEKIDFSIFQWENIAQTYLEIYDQVCES
jgi:glycosyltransferase involved in cell wall biosynthesis